MKRVSVTHIQLIFLACLTFLITGCGDNETGSLTVHVAWLGGTVPSNVQPFLIFSIEGKGIDPASQTFEQRTKSRIDVTELATGGKTVTLWNTDSQGHRFYEGQSHVTIVKNQNTETTVTLKPIAPLLSVAVTPTNPSISVGGTQQFTATGTFSDGTTEDLTSLATWSSSITAVATIHTTGLATGLSAGTVTITATFSGISGTATMTVTSATVMSITVTPTNPSISVGGTQQFTATGTFSDGTNGELTSLAKRSPSTGPFSDDTKEDLTSLATWSSSNTAVATISTGGLATGVGTGTTTITAAFQSMIGTTTLTITPFAGPVLEVTPDTLSFVATPGEAPPSQTINIRNTGTGTLSWNISQGSTADFPISISPSSGTTTDETDTVEVDFFFITLEEEEGGQEGIYSSSLTITATGASGSPKTIPVTLTILPGRTLPATNITNSSATLNGKYNNPVGETTTLHFEFGSTTSYGSVSEAQANASSGLISFSKNLTGLTDATTFHYRLVATNSKGTFLGNDVVFTTLPLPTVLASGLSNPGPIDVMGETLYFADSAGIKSVPVAGGPVSTVATTSSMVAALKVDATRIYWAEGFSPYTIKSIPLGGGVATTLAGSLTNGVNKIVVDANSVYFLQEGSVNKVPIGGGLVVSLASGLISASDRSIAIDSENVYWSDSGGINKVGINGGIVTVLKTGWAQFIAVDSTALYFDDFDSIRKMGKNGGTATTLGGAGTCCGSVGLVIDSLNVYSGTAFFLSKVSINGGDTIPLVNRSDSGCCINHFVIDNTYLYWTHSSGTIEKIPHSSATLLTSIAITPTNPEIGPGTTQQFTATGTFSDGRTENLTLTATWDSSNTGVATVSNTGGSNGLATGVAVGTTTIKASVGSISGSTTLTVP